MGKVNFSPVYFSHFLPGNAIENSILHINYTMRVAPKALGFKLSQQPHRALVSSHSMNAIQQRATHFGNSGAHYAQHKPAAVFDLMSGSDEVEVSKVWSVALSEGLKQVHNRLQNELKMVLQSFDSQFRIFDNYSQAVLDGNSPLSFEQYIQLCSHIENLLSSIFSVYDVYHKIGESGIAIEGMLNDMNRNCRIIAHRIHNDISIFLDFESQDQEETTRVTQKLVEQSQWAQEIFDLSGLGEFAQLSDDLLTLSEMI